MSSGNFLLRRAIYEDLHGNEKEEQEDETVQGEELVDTYGPIIPDREKHPDAERRGNTGTDSAGATP
jgi:hypothetical protein